jgi:serine protease Do
MIRADYPKTAFAVEGTGSGTGIVIDDTGHILTNAHVVEGASSVIIALPGSTAERPARIVGVSSCDDLAVLQVDDTDGLRPASLGNATQLRPGSEVIALGYPLADHAGEELTVTRGIVSKKDIAIAPYDSLIQTDAAINHGNSGGPLVDATGQVIGINTLALNPAVGSDVGYAIAIDKATKVSEVLSKGERRQWLGINFHTFEFEDGSAALAVDGVETGSPAARIGVRPGDWLLTMEGTAVSSRADVCKILRSHSDGAVLRLEILRMNEDEHIDMLAGELAIADPKGGQALEVIQVVQSAPTAQEPTASEPASASDTATVGYDFEPGTDTSGWFVGETDRHRAAVSQGLYALGVFPPRTQLVSPALAVEPAADMSIVADVLPMEDTRAGVAVRYRREGNLEYYYTCWIEASTHYGCFVLAGDRLTALAEGDTQLVRSDTINRISLVAAGDQLEFSANGTVVASFSDTSVAAGVPGVYIENFDQPGVAGFDNITIAALR